MKKLIFCVFLLLSITTYAEEAKKSVCLNMIVKDETKVIRRCLDSVRPIIDYWVIVDTGSSDGTQEMIKNHMKDIPGELHERPWKNFGHNRNEALQLAKEKGDYVLFIDADEVLVYEDGFHLPDLNKDFYYIMTHYGGTNYARVQLIKNSLDWKWKGVLHECVDCPKAFTSAIIPGVFNDVHTDGARSQDPEKYLKDVRTLEAGLLEEPNNTRYVFYLAQSYRDAGDYENSLKYYQKRIEMGGWNEEIYWSMLQSALLQRLLNKPDEEYVASLHKAHNYRPSRIEALYHLASYYRTHDNSLLAYAFSTKASKLPQSSDILFVEQWMYDYGIALELSIAAYWINKYDECDRLCRQILSRPDLPQNIRECVERNLVFAEQKLQTANVQ
jgi:glycosyltransferase involved in cell wall biosynthesis